jgi:hypothetical protein
MTTDINEKSSDLPRVTDTVYHIMLYRVHIVTLVVICTDCKGSCKSNNNTITTMRASYMRMNQLKIQITSVHLYWIFRKNPMDFLHQLNKTDCHKITEILLIVALNTITLIHSDVVRFYREQERLYILMYKWYTWTIVHVALNNKSLIHHIECFVWWLRKYFWKKNEYEPSNNYSMMWEICCFVFCLQTICFSIYVH